MKKKLSVVLAGIMTVVSLAGCGGGSPAASSTTAAGGGDGAAAKAELNLIIASNQTSLDNPYSYGMDK